MSPGARQPDAPEVYVVVPTWNGRDLSLDCLRSLTSIERPRLRVTAIDNGSSDGTPAAIRAAEPRVEVVEMGENRGFTGAVNAGLARARESGAEFALLLNSDATVAADTIELLVEALRAEPRAAVAGPTVHYADRRDVIWSAGGTIDWRRGSTRMLGIDEVDRGQFGDVPRPVPFVTGCAMLLRLASLPRVGEFDARFFAYWEEVEWCVRCARAGLRILHVPRARAWHHISPEARAASPLVHYYMTRNRLLFLRRAGLPASAWVYTLLFDYARTLLSWTLRPKWRAKRPQRDAMLRALADYRGGRFGRAPLGSA